MIESTTHSTSEVLIVGGSVVGLSAALFLAQHGIAVTLVERRERRQVHPRARGFHQRTIELFRPTVAGAEIERQGAIRPGEKGGGTLRALTLTSPPDAWTPAAPASKQPDISPAPFVYLGQDRLEPILLDAARKLGVDVRLGWELVSWEEDDHGVAARLRDRHGDPSSVAAKYLIAADGARSAVREGLGISSLGAGVLGRNLSIVFEADLSVVTEKYPFGFAIVTHPQSGGVIVTTDRRDRYIYAVPAAAHDEAMDDGKWADLLRQATGLAGLKPKILGSFAWDVAENVAERFGAGRIFLCGDAAHQMPPSGGWGANVGIQDAANLAWKVALVLRGRASPALLKTYDAERRPVAAATAREARLRAEQMGSPGREPSAPLAEDGAVMMSYRYGVPEPIPWKLSLEAAPGQRAAHIWLQLDGQRISTIDLFGRGFVLLASSGKWRGAAKQVAVELDVECAFYAAAELRIPYGIGPGGAVLVRPDGVVSERWAAAPGDRSSALSSAMKRALGWIDRPTPGA